VDEKRVTGEAAQGTKGEQTRREILVAAKRLFLSQGFTATPMRQIALEVGITPAAIYNHFPSKDELFTAVVQDTAPYAELFALFGQIEADTAEDLLRQAFQYLFAFIADHEDYLQLAQIDAQERDGATLATFMPQVVPQALRWHQRLIALDAGQGRLRDVPFLVFLRTLISLLAGFILTRRVAMAAPMIRLPEVDWAQALADIFVYGVLAPAEPGAEEGAAGP
jgi:AcrR family transcriptional regulator